jgi:hypothetical protein
MLLDEMSHFERVTGPASSNRQDWGGFPATEDGKRIIVQRTKSS